MPTERDLAAKLNTAVSRGQFTGWRRMYTGKRTTTGVTLDGAATGKCWVRAEETSREETQVWGYAARINIPVYVGPNVAGELEIKTVDQHAAAFTAGDAAEASILPPITPDNNPNLLIGGRQFKPGRMRLSALGGLYVYVEPFHYPGGYWPGGDFQLTAPSTASTQAWCAVAMNPADDTLYQFTGTEYALPYLLTEAELGNLSVTEGYIPVGAVVLYNGQTAITGAEAWADFRYHFAQAGGNITGFVALAPASDTRNTVQPAGDHPALILKNNASQTDNPFQAQTSAGAVNVAITPLGGLVVNEQGADADTRIEGDTDANLLFVDASTDRVGIGTNAPTAKFHVAGTAALDLLAVNQASVAASAVLDAASTTKGVLIPRMTTTQRDAISSPATGLMVYNTSTSAFNFYNGSSWAAVGAGAATITVKEADGTPNVSGVSTVVVSNGTLTDDGGGQVTISIAGGSTPYSLCQGRLTLTSGTAVTTSDVTAATTLYFTPYKGNQIGLYSGSTWNLFTFSELSLSLSGYTADKNYDIWVYDNVGTVTLESTVWTDDTTRATALTTQDGIYVKSGATTRRYLGTIRITGTTGQTEDSVTKRYVWNHYNQQPRMLLKTVSTASWTYQTATYRQSNADTGNQVDLVVGLVTQVWLEFGIATESRADTTAIASIGIDSTTASSAVVTRNHFLNSTLTNFERLHRASYIGYPAVGRHYYAMIEQASAVSGNCTWYGNSSSRLASLYGSVHG